MTVRHKARSATGWSQLVGFSAPADHWGRCGSGGRSRARPGNSAPARPSAPQPGLRRRTKARARLRRARLDLCRRFSSWLLPPIMHRGRGAISSPAVPSHLLPKSALSLVRHQSPKRERSASGGYPGFREKRRLVARALTSSRQQRSDGAGHNLDPGDSASPTAITPPAITSA